MQKNEYIPLRIQWRRKQLLEMQARELEIYGMPYLAWFENLKEEHRNAN